MSTRSSPSSRRGLVVGTGAVLAAVALPAGVRQAVAAEAPSTAEFEALPAAFDPAAFCRDLLDAGCRLRVVQPVWCGSDDEDLRPSYFIQPSEGRGFGKGYSAVMSKWSVAMDACPDRVARVVAYALGQSGDVS